MAKPQLRRCLEQSRNSLTCQYYTKISKANYIIRDDYKIPALVKLFNMPSHVDLWNYLSCQLKLDESIWSLQQELLKISSLLWIDRCLNDSVYKHLFVDYIIADVLNVVNVSLFVLWKEPENSKEFKWAAKYETKNNFLFLLLNVGR